MHPRAGCDGRANGGGLLKRRARSAERSCIRKRNGIPTAAEREKMGDWNRFLKAHWEGLIGADFFTTEVLTRAGLLTYYTLFVIDLKSRIVHVCGSTLAPNEQWMNQIARNFTDCMDGFANGKTHLIIDRDTKYSPAFKAILLEAGVRITLCPPRVPRCNAFAERFVKSIKYECLNLIIVLGSRHLEASIRCYVEHYNRRRNHQGVGNILLSPEEFSATGLIKCQSEMGGMFNYYYREAA